jgi:hypothetical protein
LEHLDMLSWTELAKTPEVALQHYDVAHYHFACATGLPDAPTTSQVAECIDRLNHYARCVEHFTLRRWPEFHQRPQAYDYNEDLFRVVCMIKLLQTQFGVRYNPAKRAEDAKLTTADVFMHGALLGEGGTCSSLPVVYVAVGRRLGYPLKLVPAWRHLFCRWDAGDSRRFNIEVNDTGVNVHPDDYYRQGRYSLPPGLEQQSTYLKSLTPRQELGCFLSERGHRWLDLGNHKQALEAFIWSSILTPGDKIKEAHVVEVMSRWRQNLKARSPNAFPKLQVKMPKERRWPSIPLQVEQEAIFLEAWAMMLDRPQLDTQADLPRPPRPARKPTSIEITMHH